ncbi:hypothetical protein F2Q69_00024798 [Brassica cretica]|uniref:Uncharacterized protein n=1 Tax=Brassica cretica TaxID=69181 RepID=A0A8S9Q985_BRACR|nr:hypothetical protein F2Q69_00024798 [Brassica cretica]
MSSEVYYRSWMDKPHLDPNTNLLTEEYVQGIGEFMRLVQQQPDAKSGRYVVSEGLTGRYVASGSKPRRVQLVFVVKSQWKLRLRQNEKRFDEDSNENAKEDLSEALQVAM